MSTHATDQPEFFKGLSFGGVEVSCSPSDRTIDYAQHYVSHGIKWPALDFSIIHTTMMGKESTSGRILNLYTPLAT
jgi:hypothetical protein